MDAGQKAAPEWMLLCVIDSDYTEVALAENSL
jgi:hypothetical protein